MKIIRLVIITLMVFSPLLSGDTYTFEDLGLGDIIVNSLSSTTRSAYFSTTIRGKANINITIYHNGSLIISIEINGVKTKLRDKSVVIQTNLTQNNTLKITATNYGANKAIIYSNSTIRIYQAKGENPANSKSSLWLKASFIMSIAIPPLIILIIRRRFRFEEKEASEIVVV